MPTTFQTSINVVQAPGLPGDFASADPHASFVTSGAVLVATTGGVTIGCFAWVNAAQTLVASTGTGAPSGFVHRELQATITFHEGLTFSMRDTQTEQRMYAGRCLTDPVTSRINRIQINGRLASRI